MRAGGTASLTRVKYVVAFLVSGLAIFVVPQFLSGTLNDVFRTSLIIIFFYASRILGGETRAEENVFFGFFVVSLVTYLDHLSYRVGLSSLDSIENPLSRSLLGQVVSTSVIVAPIVIISITRGEGLGSVYLQRGRLWQGLAIGLGSLMAMLALVLYDPRGASALFPVNEELSNDALTSLLVYVLPFVLLNGLREELWFRGALLRRTSLHVGGYSANFVISLVFALGHLGVEYTPVLLAFLAIVFTLGFIWGVIILKTDSLIGAILFHAAMDIPVVLGIFSFLA